MIKNQNRLTLGELLIRAGIITEAELDEIASDSSRICIPLGQCLLSEQKISKTELQAVVQVHSLIMDCAISPEQGSEILAQVLSNGCSFDDVIDKHVPDIKSVTRYQLGVLLVGAKLINREQLNEALQRSVEEGVPLGHILVHERHLTAECVDLALQLQDELRQGTLTFDQVISELKRAR